MSPLCGCLFLNFASASRQTPVAEIVSAALMVRAKIIDHMWSLKESYVIGKTASIGTKKKTMFLSSNSAVFSTAQSGIIFAHRSRKSTTIDVRDGEIDDPAHSKAKSQAKYTPSIIAAPNAAMEKSFAFLPIKSRECEAFCAEIKRFFCLKAPGFFEIVQ